MSGPLLDSALATSGSIQVSSFAAPAVDPAGDEILLVGLVGISSVTPRTMTPPVGWTKDVEVTEINSPNGTNSTHRLSINHRVVSAAAPPYADVFTSSGAAWWGIEQLALRSSGTQPDNHGSAHAQYDDTNPDPALRGATNPTLSADFDSGADAGIPTAGNVLVAAFAVDGLGGPYTGDGQFHFPGDWTYLGETGGIWGFGRIGYAWKEADGTETGIGDVSYGSNRIGMSALVIAEFHADPAAIPDRVGWDVYAANDLGGPILATLENASERLLRVEEDGAGVGGFTINRHSPEATAAVLAKGNLVRVRIPEISDDYIGGFFLETGDFDVLSLGEEGEEDLHFGGKGLFSYLNRARMDAAAYSTGLDTVDTWTEIWKTSKVTNPVGACLVDDDPTYLYVISATTRKIYKLRQSDRAIVGSTPALWSGSDNYAGGLCADPSDNTILWALESPWALGGVGNTKIRKIDISGSMSGWNVADTFDLGSAVKLTDVECSSGNLWTTKYDGPDLQKRSKSDGSVVDSYSITYGGVAQVNATGSSINGSQIALWFAGKKRALIADLSDPETIVDKISTTGLSAFGGAWTTEGANDYFYPVSYTADVVWKYQITSATPHDPVDGIWRLDEGTPGAILARIMAEIQHVDRPQQPVPDLTYGFDFSNDTGANAWASHPGTIEFTANIGDLVDETVLRLVPYGLTVQMLPSLELAAYNEAAFGTDRTSGSFGAGKVRVVAGVNAAEALRRRMDDRKTDSHMLVTGNDGKYARSVDDDLGYVREGHLSTNLDDVGAMEGTGDAELARERRDADAQAVSIPWGDDEAAGLYLPGPSGTNGHYWVGDTIRVHTGTGPFDLNEQDRAIKAITISEIDAEGDEQPGGWSAVADLAAVLIPIYDPVAPATSPTSVGGTSGAGSTTTTVKSSLVFKDSANGESYSGSTIESDDWGVSQPGTGRVAITLKRRKLAELLDVELDAIADGQGIAWDDALEAWIPVDLGGGGGGVIAIPYTFSTTTADADPGDGTMRLSNASQYLAVTARLDLTDAEGADVTALLDDFADPISTVKGYLRIGHATDPTKWLVATVSAVASPAGYRNLTIANVAKSATSPFADGDPVMVSFDFATLTAKLDDLSAPDDNTDLNASTGAHGLLPKLSGNATDRLSGDGSWVASSGAAALAASTGDVTTTSSLADVTGCSVSLSPGTYVVAANFDVLVNSNADRTFEGHLDVGGSDQTKIATLVDVGLDTGDRVPAMQLWLVTVGVTTTVKLRVKHSGGAAGDFTAKGNTTIAAWTAGTTTPLSKYDATTAPTVNEDSGDGYSVGSRWIDVTNDRAWICVDATVGAAVWLLSPAGGSGGGWIAYTPTWTASTTNPTVGNGTLVGHYRYLDSKTIAVRIRLTIGSSTNLGNGNYSFSLPLTTDAVDDQSILCRIFRTSGSVHTVGLGNIALSSTSIVRAGTSGNIMSHNTPFAWVAGDQIRFQGVVGIA